MISLDCETTGLDLAHTARPYLVTTSDGETTRHWQWRVNPVTREVLYDEDELDEIEEVISNADRIVGQNIKFDIKALATVRPNVKNMWPWDRTEDTLIAGHVLASGAKHDLTAMCLDYLESDITPYEDAAEKATREAVRRVRTNLKGWFIAGKDREGMPSAKKSVWKMDMWLPRELVLHCVELNRRADHADAPALSQERLFGLPPQETVRLTKKGVPSKAKVAKPKEPWWKPYARHDHPWLTVTEEYANTDSLTTWHLFEAQLRELRERGLEKIYRRQLRLIRVLCDMEWRGVTLSGTRLDELTERYAEESSLAKESCENIAATFGYELHMPRNGRNAALDEFVFDVMKLPVIKTTKKSKKSKTEKSGGNPSLDADTLKRYEELLPANSRQLLFVKRLRGARMRDTGVSYMGGYKKFWLALENRRRGGDWHVLYPWFNQTGTGTTRLSSQNPNAQNISRKEGFNLRHCFGPAPGREWWSMDFENIELRIPAYASGEKAKIDLFERAHEPPFYGSEHMLNFSYVYEDIWLEELRAVGPEKVSAHIKKKYESTNYRWCKAGDFALQYQCGRATANKAFRRNYAYDLLKSKFALLDAYNTRLCDHAKKYGYVEILPDRNVDPERGYPLMTGTNAFGGLMPTTPLSYVVQGTAGQAAKSAMIRCHERLEDWRYDDGFDGHLIMQVHDENVFDVPAGEGDEPWRRNLDRMVVLRDLMELSGDDIGVPLKVSICYHASTWSEEIKLKV